MPKTIQQTVRFDAPVGRVFDLYADAKLHSAATGAKATISARPGSRFTAHGGWIVGETLSLKRPRLIVQRWRGKDWSKAEEDSVLILIFRKTARGSELKMVHANVPDAHVKAITAGWDAAYWTPWKAYLAEGGGKAKAAPKAKRSAAARRKPAPRRPARPAQRSRARR